MKRYAMIVFSILISVLVAGDLLWWGTSSQNSTSSRPSEAKLMLSRSFLTDCQRTVPNQSASVSALYSGPRLDRMGYLLGTLGDGSYSTRSAALRLFDPNLSKNEVQVLEDFLSDPHNLQKLSPQEVAALKNDVMNLNQITSVSGSVNASLTYDVDGNRLTEIQGIAKDTYSYDAENRLVTLNKHTGTSGTGTYNYQYDYRTRRILRDESEAGGAKTQIVFSGGTSVQEYDNGTATPTVEYIRGSDYGGGVGGILYTLRNGLPSYTHANKRGDITSKADGTGKVTYLAQYQAFGNQVATYGSTPDRQKSNSKDTDPTGLVDEGMRYYDLLTETFTTRDPAGMIDGPNEYTYVKQNPWTKFDPEGLTDANTNLPPAPKGDWNHGISKTGAAGDLARSIGVNVNGQKWGYNLPGGKGGAHTSANPGPKGPGGGIHSNSYVDENGKLQPKGKLDPNAPKSTPGNNRNWNTEWNKWARGFQKANGREATEKAIWPNEGQ